MAKKIVKKTKLNVVNFLIVLIVLIGLSFCVYLSLQIKIKNIVINGNSYLNDDYIINLAGIYDYPKFITFNRKTACSKLKKSDYISDCSINKKSGFVLKVNIVENRALFFDTNSDKYVLENKEKSSGTYTFRVPRLLNYVPDKKYEKFITSMSKINKESLSLISDIEYKPNEYDKDRFLLYMDDGNMVYLTLTKFKMINLYKDVVPQLEGHKGILYLDSGNHFIIKE